MSRTKGSRNPERLITPRLREAATQVKEMSEEELVVLRGLAIHQLALLAERRDEPRRQRDEQRAELIADLDAADARCQQATGRGLSGPSDYNKYRPAGAPSHQTIYRHFGGPFRRVLFEAGLAATSRPEARLVLEYAPGRNGRLSADGDRYSPAEKDHAMAFVIEKCLGRKPSRDQIEDVRQGVVEAMPGYDALRKRGSEKISLDEAYERGVAVVLSWPEQYPRAYAYLQSRRRGR